MLISSGKGTSGAAQTPHKVRTARNFMNYAKQCDEVNRVLPYRPNSRAGKSATVAVLESPEDPAEIEDIKSRKPRHDSEPLAWSASETASRILEIFEKMTEHRKIEDVEDAAELLKDLLSDYVERRREERGKLFSE